MRARLILPVLLAAACTQPARLVRSDAERVLTLVSLETPNPGSRGPHEVRRFYYGSGTDKRRAEFRDSVLVRTRAVNAQPFLRGIDAKEARKRWRYWGFNRRELPLNGRVWYPVGEGPFPLILIVHGNHSMKEYSDPGYAYLGELLASRGFITVSVDQNFLNGGIRTENDARGWMLLKHLEAWRAMERDPSFPLRGRVDLQRVGLIGHSRGGEAAAVAAGFNRLAHYPDDARIAFDFNFGIRALIAIAPVDGQYRPADRLPPVEGVNYFVIHGSHDADVSTFIGLRTYLRADVREPGLVKAALYVYRANHGQFNTVWGDNDVGKSGWLLNKKALLTGEEQRGIGRVFFSGFLEMALHGRREYEPMFRDYRTVGGWLPKTMYVSHFANGRERIVADFEEDIDVTTATLEGARVESRGLSTWRESAIESRVPARGTTFESNAVMLGWSAPRDSVQASDSLRAWYALRLTAEAVGTLGIDRGSALTFGVVDMGRRPSPLSAADTLTPPAPAAPGARRDTVARPKPPAKAAATVAVRRDPPADSIRVDFTVELLLSDGRSAALPVSSVAALRPPLTVRLYRHAYIERKLTGPPRDHEYVPQRVSIPLARFATLLPGFDPAAVRGIRFRFDRSPAGTILLDDVGFEVR
jgi:dienelactone hydrolase